MAADPLTQRQGARRVQYLAADGEPIHGRGLRPTVAVESPSVGFDDAPPAADAMLTKAIERLKTRTESTERL